jgi:hypothetical protein
MGLKSSPYHLKKFLDKAYSQEALKRLRLQKPKEEEDLLPQSTYTVDDINVSYFDDSFVLASTYEETLAALKITLMIARGKK